MIVSTKALDMDGTKSIRGAAALLVLLSHMGLQNPISRVGFLCVAVFFFFSGFGLMRSLSEKKGYLDGFFKKRLPAIVLPYYTACIFYIAFIAVLGYHFTAKTLVWSVLNPFIDTYRYISVAWYICVLGLLYALFYVSFRFFRNIMSYVVLAVGFAVFYGVSTYVKPEYWIMSAPAFLVGIVMGSAPQREIRVSSSIFGVLLMGSIAAFYLSFYKRLDVHGHMASASIIAIIVLLLQIISLRRIRLLNFYGAIAFEFYLVHPLMIQFINNDGIFIGPTIGRASCYWPHIFSLRLEPKLIQITAVLILASITGYALNWINSRLLTGLHHLIQAPRSNAQD